MAALRRWWRSVFRPRARSHRHPPPPDLIDRAMEEEEAARLNALIAGEATRRPWRDPWAVLDAAAPLGAFARLEALPCCTLVALWAREVAGMYPRPYPSPDGVLGPIRASAPGWWERANVWPRVGDPWSCPKAVRDLLGGVVEGPVRVAGSAPELTSGRWHVVQRWRSVEGTARGHAYLVHAAADLCTVVESDEGRGYCTTVGTWSGSAGLAGYDVAVLTLPAEV